MYNKHVTTTKNKNDIVTHELTATIMFQNHLHSITTSTVYWLMKINTNVHFFSIICIFCTDMSITILAHTTVHSDYNSALVLSKRLARSWVEQGLTSHQTHYRSYRGGKASPKWPFCDEWDVKPWLNSTQLVQWLQQSAVHNLLI